VVSYTFELSRAPADPAAAPTRLSTASGLDNFEVVKIPAEDLARFAGDGDNGLPSATEMVRALDAATTPRPAAEQSLLDDVVALNLYNTQNALLIDLERCTRCDECVRACAVAHDGVARFTRDGPRFGKYLVTMACRSCTDPKCMIGCPVGSIRRRDSLEVQIEDWCIGCQRCATQCPFGNINMVELAAKPDLPPAVTEDVTLRATVCDLCAGYDGPNCVYACPHDATIRVNPAAFLAPADQR
jgi:Fe-S-cluster-containing hydrogenase component 2